MAEQPCLHLAVKVFWPKMLVGTCGSFLIILLAKYWVKKAGNFTCKWHELTANMGQWKNIVWKFQFFPVPVSFWYHLTDVMISRHHLPPPPVPLRTGPEEKGESWSPSPLRFTPGFETWMLIKLDGRVVTTQPDMCIFAILWCTLFVKSQALTFELYQLKNCKNHLYHLCMHLVIWGLIA